MAGHRGRKDPSLERVGRGDGCQGDQASGPLTTTPRSWRQQGCPQGRGTPQGTGRSLRAGPPRTRVAVGAGAGDGEATVVARLAAPYMGSQVGSRGTGRARPEGRFPATTAVPGPRLPARRGAPRAQAHPRGTGGAPRPALQHSISRCHIKHLNSPTRGNIQKTYQDLILFRSHRCSKPLVRLELQWIILGIISIA